MQKKNNQVLIIILLVAAVIFGIIAKIFGGGGVSSSASRGNVIVNEVMASNTSSVPDDLGKYSDWIELYNRGETTVSLEGWGLSDNKLKPARWAFPKLSLEPGEFVIIYCSGEDKRDPTKGALHTNFKLSSRGEQVILIDNLGGIVDLVDYDNIESNVSFGRISPDSNEWQIFERATPGFANTDEGYSDYIESIKLDTSNLILSEIMSSNRVTIMDDYGEYPDYVEIQNIGDVAVDLQGYGLSDRENNVMRWRFPDVTIEPGEFLVIFCSGRGQAKDPESGILHSNFRISSYRETIILTSNMGQVIDSIEVRELNSDTVYARDPSTEKLEWREMTKPTPGFPNTDEGFNQFIEKGGISKGPIVINEIMLYNDKYAKASDNQYYDWIELKNISNESVNLSRWGISDNTKNPAKFRLPDFTLGPGEVKLLYASGLNKKTDTAAIHTNFRLAAKGEVLGLFDPEGNLVDRIFAEQVPLNMSYGRMDNAIGYYYFQSPSPGNTNTGGVQGFSTKPVIEKASGSYRGAQTITLSCEDKNAAIHYTLDGSKPTQNSPKYTGPITIEPKKKTVTLHDDSPYELPQGTSLRARTFKPNMMGSPIASASYLIDVPHTLPIISITMDPDDFSGSERGIHALGQGTKQENGSYVNANFLYDWEREAFFEYIDEEGTQQMGMDGGIRIFGGFSRYKDQKGFSLWARGRYGQEMIPYPFFDTRPYTEYKSIVLRAGANDCNRTKIRDVVITDLAREATDLDLMAYKSSVVYINGDYRGIYHIREKMNKYFLAQHHGISDPEAIHLVVGNRNALVGDNKDFLDLRNFIDNNDMSDPANYEKVKERMDVQNFIDWTIVQVWSNNTDLGNIKYWRSQQDGTENSKWRWILYDFCWGMDNPVTDDGFARHLNPNGMGVGKGISTVFLRKLLNNAEFKALFLERLALHLNTSFSAERVVSRINEVAATIEDEIPRDFARWGLRQSSWKDNQIPAIISWVQQRNGYLIYYARGHFNLTEAQAIELFGSAGVAPPTKGAE